MLIHVYGATDDYRYVEIARYDAEIKPRAGEHIWFGGGVTQEGQPVTRKAYRVLDVIDVVLPEQGLNEGRSGPRPTGPSHQLDRVIVLAVKISPDHQLNSYWG